MFFGQKKKTKSRSTSVKVTNKKLNKFAKQGKLRKLRLRQKKKELKQSRNQEKTDSKNKHTAKDQDGLRAEEGEEENLGEEDIKYFTNTTSSFVSSVSQR